MWISRKTFEDRKDCLAIIFNESAVEKLNRSHTMREKPDWIPVGKEGERI
jgi:hypothetical protein